MGISDLNSDVGSSDLLTGREHLGCHHGGDGVGGVVEAVDELEYERGEDHHQHEGQHATGPASAVLEHDLVGHHARLAAAVDGLFQDLEEFLEQEHLQVVELARVDVRSEEQKSELQSLMRISYAFFCLKKKKIHILKP